MSEPLIAPFDRLAERIRREGEILAAILANGGKLVASFVLDADGRTVGAPITHNKRTHCSNCGGPGHTTRRCNGFGNEPKLTYAAKEKIARLRKRADYDLEEAKAEIARRIEAKGKR